ncbi:MAG: PhnD/SsuA/transferrin family substrate-binding protein [Clostridiales bacterium]|nr:PhnD/SsuA/transferrin family substrate-binding protein [Clostridiales bacterium]MCD7827985.1 PhnD/SsuA/transferrin family substrate-binding protein [Clostridiales bacterium]
MKSKKIIAMIMAALLMLLSFAACSGDTTDEVTTEPETASDAAETDAINVSVLKGPTGMGAAYMWTKSDSGETEYTYNFTLDTDATTVGPKLMTGEYDIASIPTNLAASLYQKSGGKVKVVAVNTLGVLYLVTKDNAVSSLEDLRGMTILASGQGTIAEYALNYVLESYGYEIGTDVTIEFSTEHSESVTKALAGGYDVVLLPEPYVTQIINQDSSFSVAINLTEEWENLGSCTLTMGCIAVNSDFYDSNPEAVASFIADYRESAEYVNANPAEASLLIEEHDIMTASVAASAIPNSNIVCYTGETMKAALESCFTVLYSQDASIIGGAMPDDDFYIYVEE